MGKGIVKKVSAALLSLIVSFGTVSPVFAEEAVPSAPADTESLQSEAAETEDNNQSVQEDQNFSASSKTTPSDSTADNAAAAAASAESSEPLEEQNTETVQEENNSASLEQPASNNNNTPVLSDNSQENTPAADDQQGEIQQPDSSLNVIESAETSENGALEVPQTISFAKMRAARKLTAANVFIEIDGDQQPNTVTIQPGIILDNIDLSQLGSNVHFRKAIVRKTLSDGKVEELEIKQVGCVDENTYYSLDESSETGILLENDEQIVLICGTESDVLISMRYYDSNGKEENNTAEISTGSVTANTVLNGNVLENKVVGGEDLELQIEAGKYYHIQSVEIKQNNADLVNQHFEESSDNEHITVPGHTIKSNLTVTVEFAKDQNYSIKEGNVANHGGICGSLDQKNIATISPGGTATFYMYSQSWSGVTWPGRTYKWYLNILRINGQNINLPAGYAEKDKSVTQNGTLVNELKDSSVTVEVIDDDGDVDFDIPDASDTAHRVIYKITVTDVSSDLTIDYNFKEEADREIYIEREGISKFAAAYETSEFISIFPPYTRWSYGLQEDDGDDVYKTYYRDGGTSYNIYAFNVAPGFSSHSEDITLEYEIIDENGNSSLVPADEMFYNNDTEIRESDNLMNLLKEEYSESDSYVAGKPTWIANYSTLEKDVENGKYEYMFMLAQQGGENQRLTIKARPYEYRVQFNLGEDADGYGYYYSNELDSSKYKYDAVKHLVIDTSTETGTYNFKMDDPHTIMPSVKPHRDGYIFKGWKISVKNGNSTDEEKVLNPNETFSINEDNLKYAQECGQASDGSSKCDYVFEFDAIWEQMPEQSKEAIYSVKYYKEIFVPDDYMEQPDNTFPDDEIVESESGDHIYKLYFRDDLSGKLGSNVAVLDYKEPNDNSAEYVLNTDKSVTQTKITSGGTNQLCIFYDLKMSEITITKKTTGYADNKKKYDLQIALKDKLGNLIETGKYQGISINDSENYQKISVDQPLKFSVPTGYKISIKEIKDDSITVTYKINDQEVPLIDDKPVTEPLNILITNNKEISPDTSVDDSDAGHVSLAIVAGALLVFFILFWERRYVQRE